MIRRRDLLALAAAGAALPIAAQAQQGRVPLLVVLARPLQDSWRRAIFDGLGDFGYVDGKNIQIDIVISPTEADMPTYAAQAIARRPEVILTSGTLPALALQEIGTTVPVVFTSIIDPVLLHLVPNLAHPGGTMTGNTILGANLAGKALELLRELLPKISRIALFETSDNQEAAVRREQLRVAGGPIGLDFIPIDVKNVGEDFAPYFGRAKAIGAQAIYLAGYLSNGVQAGPELYKLSLQGGWPTLATTSGNLESGGLFSYGANNPAIIRRSIYYVDAILKGANPGDLAVELPTVFELVVNLRAAKALGIAVPPGVLFRADRVIE